MGRLDDIEARLDELELCLGIGDDEDGEDEEDDDNVAARALMDARLEATSVVLASIPALGQIAVGLDRVQVRLCQYQWVHAMEAELQELANFAASIKKIIREAGRK